MLYTPTLVPPNSLDDSLIVEMQQLRAVTYLADGSIKPKDIDSQGRFVMDGDNDCWHMLLMHKGKVIGAMRYRIYDAQSTTFEDLHVSHCPNAKVIKSHIELDLDIARKLDWRYIEVGGWAIHPDYRVTSAALTLILGSFAIGQLVGGALGCCTAALINNSAKILKRIGGRAILGCEPYYDERWDCMIEVLRFDSEAIPPKYRQALSEVKGYLREVFEFGLTRIVGFARFVDVES